ncbi:hypothetical protein [Phaeobacter sp. B1627]|uniref:hypothetical protein n=1 Tax=Phaeobacter sp. B1627 TaxID=2583809 RepID=UPI001117C369|nr:hypothetical protein [Phaeobacter sp. B1627]TNJ40863.1 hypothetical protein FGE21_16130 [Phaeobacter sp. B1627]
MFVYFRKMTAALATCLLVAQCSTIEREAGYPGGNLGYLADRHAIFAKGQEERVNRHLISLALVAPLIAETARTSGEAKLSSHRIADLYAAISKLKKAANICKLALNAEGTLLVTGDGACTIEQITPTEGSSFHFETLSLEVSKSLNDALKQAYDNLNIKAGAKSFVKLSPSDMLKNVFNARRLVPILMDYLATFRDVTLVFGHSVAESCGPKTGWETKFETACQDVNYSFKALMNRTRTLDADIASEERPIKDVLDASEAAINAGLPWTLSKVQVAALLFKVNRACRKLEALAKAEDENFTGCAVDWSEVQKSNAPPVADAKANSGSIAKADTTNNVNALINQF